MFALRVAPYACENGQRDSENVENALSDGISAAITRGSRYRQFLMCGQQTQHHPYILAVM